MERTRAQALRELRSLLSEVLSTAASDEQVPAAFKNPQNWEHLIKRTEARLSEAWKQRFEPRQDGREPKGAALELLAEDEQEQAVLSERFVNEVLEEQAEPLEDLDQQLAAMSGVQPDPTRKNPLGPDTWADGVRSGLREIECSTDDRDWLMEQLMPLLADRVAQFYAAMSQQMGAAGFASPHRPGSKRAAPRVSAEAKKQAASGGFAPEQVEARSGPAQPLLAGDGLDGGDGGAQLEHLLGLIGAQRGAGAMAAFGGVGDGDGSGDAGGAPAQPWSQAELMSVLGAMQAGADGAAAALATPGGLKKAIAGTARQLGLDGGVGAMPAQAQDTLALVSMLFEVLLDGKRLDERARSQLARLIVPYVRVAVLDRHLFMQAMHPGRRVLNLLVEALETASQDVPQFKRLRELAFETIENIVTQFSDDIAIFAPLEQALAAEIESSRRRAELAEKRAAEAHSGRERREHARDLVAAFLSEAMFGKRMPNALLEFLVGPWQHHQNVTLLREGEGAPDVLANEALLRDLLADSDRGAFADPAAMQSRIAEVLESSGQGEDGAKDLMAQLETAFRAAKAPKRAAPAGDGKPGSTVPLPAPEPAVVQVVVERAVLAASAAAIVPAQENKDAFLAPDTSGADMPPDLVSKYEEMPIGTWLDLVAEDGRVTSARISWTSPISGRRILSNRRGQRILVASPQELAAMELEGGIRPRHSETAFEHALHTVAKKLEAVATPDAGAAQAAV